MEKELDRIIRTLDQTQGLYQNLLEMVLQERTAVLNSKIDQLNTLLVDKENLLAQLAALESQRIQQLKRISAQLRLPVKQLTLSTLAAHSPAQYAGEIMSRRIALRKLIRTISNANDESRSMISHCLNLVQGSLQFLQHWITPPSVYGASGNIDGKTKNGHLLSGTV